MQWFRGYILAILITLMPILATAQSDNPAEKDWMAEFESNGIDPQVNHEDTPWYRLMKNENPNVLHVMYAYEEWFRNHSFQKSYQTREYRKWIQRHYTNVDEKGRILPITPDPIGTERFLLHNKGYSFSAATKEGVQPIGSDSPWELIGPMTWDREARAATGSMGIGVIRAVEVDPTNPDNIYLGTVSAGVWISKDRGATWREATAGMLVEETREIGISKAEPSVVYGATNVGVIKSVNGGDTWSYTSLGNIQNYPAVQYTYRLAVSPASSDVLLCASGNRIYRSENGGEDWSDIYTGGSRNSIWDIEFHPTDPTIVYALVQLGNSVTFLRSSDGGKTFTPGATGYPVPVSGQRMVRGVIALSPVLPDKVNVIIAGSQNDSVSGLWGNYASWDAGLSFTHLCCGEVDGPELPDPDAGNPNILHYNAAQSGLGQATWDMGFAMSDTDTNVMVAAGIFTWRSFDGGNSWLSTPGIHYDVQDLAVGGGTIWIATDGGIYRSDDGGITITDMSDGLNTLEVWGFGQALKRPDLMVVGAYHMPIFIRDDNTYSDNGFSGGWYPWSGADAMNADINPVDDYWIYAKPWSSVRAYRSEEKSLRPSSQPLGIDLGYIPLTNIAFHPQLYHTVIAPDHGDPKRFAVSRDNAGSWETLQTFSNSVYRIRVSFSHPDWMYGIADGRLWLTKDGGGEWIDVTPPQSITTGKGLRDVVVDDKNERRIWVAFSGHQSDRKVVRSEDGGETWEDISGTLPAFGIRSMVHQRGSDGGIYVGTTLGVYYRNNSMSDWEQHGTGLPAADINFLHINYAVGKLRAGTSRGIWECDLFENAPPVAQISADRNLVACSREQVQFACGSAYRKSVQTKWSWSFPGGSPATSDEENPSVAYMTPGRYSVTLTIEDEFGSNTQRLMNFITAEQSECDGSDVAGSALDLSQSDVDYVELPDVDFTADEVTISAWVKPNGIQPDWAAIFMGDNAFGVGFKNGSNELQYHWDGGKWSWNSGLHVPPDTWSHIALTVTPDGATLYLNGVPSHNAGQHSPMVGSTAKLGQDRGFGTSRNYNGEIDEFRLYRRAFSEDEVRRMMHLTASSEEPDLVHYYQFNEILASRIYDVVSARDASFVGGAGRVISTAPVSGGSVSDSRDLNSVVDFIGTDISLGFSSGWSNSEAYVVAWHLRYAPDSLPEGVRGTSGHYWIVRGWGIEDPLPAIDSMIFSRVGMISKEDAENPSQFKLYRRDAGEHLNVWSDTERPTLSADTLVNSITFGDVATDAGTMLGQFLIATEGSSILSVERSDILSEGESGRVEHLYPNPIGTHLNIVYRTLPGESEVMMRLFDLLGREVQQMTLPLTSGTQHGLTLDVGHLIKGTYLLRVGDDVYVVVKE